MGDGFRLRGLNDLKRQHQLGSQRFVIVQDIMFRLLCVCFQIKIMFIVVYESVLIYDIYLFD